MLLLDDVYDIMGEDKFAQVKTNAFKTYLVIYSRCRSLDQWTHPISDQQLASKLYYLHLAETPPAFNQSEPNRQTERSRYWLLLLPSNCQLNTPKYDT
jgi:hypothetical protein